MRSHGSSSCWPTSTMAPTWSAIASSRIGSSTPRIFRAPFYLWIVRHLFRDNELVLGRLEIGGRRVDPQSLAMPLHLLAGAADHISPPDQVFAIADHASTADELIRRDVVPGGHLGLFMGHQSLREYWPPMLGH